MKRRLLFPVFIVCLAIAAALGFLAGRSVAPSPAPTGASAAAAPPAVKQIWTCSMHPQVRLDRPGDCPICEMPLIPADSAQGSGDGPPMLTLSDHALAMAFPPADFSRTVSLDDSTAAAFLRGELVW